RGGERGGETWERDRGSERGEERRGERGGEERRGEERRGRQTALQQMADGPVGATLWTGSDITQQTADMRRLQTPSNTQARTHTHTHTHTQKTRSKTSNTS